MPSALVAKLRKQPEVRDAEALAAWIGRYQKLRKAGVGNKKAMKLAGKQGGMKEGGVKAADRKAGGKNKETGVDPFSDDIVYDDAGTILTDREGQPTKQDLANLKGAYPEAEQVMWGDDFHDLSSVKGADINRDRATDDFSGILRPEKFGDDEQGKAVKNALKAIDKVHGVRKVPDIAVKSSARGDEEGNYRTIIRGGKVVSKDIQVNPKGATPGFTAVHEAGHHLDLTALGPGGAFGSSNYRHDPEMKAWYDTVKGTDSYKNLIRLRSEEPEYRRYYDYLLQPEEVFARSYAQYIANKSGDPDLKSGLEYWRETNTGEHWPDADFKAVESALEKIFEKKGWSRGN